MPVDVDELGLARARYNELGKQYMFICTYTQCVLAICESRVLENLVNSSTYL